MSKEEDLIKPFQKAYGKNSVRILGKDAKNNYKVVSTGSGNIDDIINNGGLVRGRIHEIYGKESSGKTTLALEVIAQAQKQGLICSYIDMEHAIDNEYMGQVGVDTSKLLLSQPEYGEQALDIAYGLISMGDVKVVVVDSVSSLVPKAVKEKSLTKQTMGLQARLMSQAMQKIPSEASKNEVMVIFINQIRQKINQSFGNPETTSAGEAMKFYTTTRLRTSRGKMEIEGVIEMHVKCIKNKVGTPFKKATTWIQFGRGIMREMEVFKDALRKGVISKNGSWYKDGEMAIGQGREAALQALIDNPEYMKEITKRTYGDGLEPDHPESDESGNKSKKKSN